MGGSSIGERHRSVIRCGGSRSFAAIVSLWLAFSMACGGSAPPPANFSLLAVGDTGAPPGDLTGYANLRAVARAMTFEDLTRPVQAVVLLGDNFYDRGLLAAELESRVRANLLIPFCRFIELPQEVAKRFADACPLAEKWRNPVRFVALLGNHDYRSAESPRLQREAIPRFVANWKVSAEPSELWEIAEGVSLVSFDSDPVFQGAPVLGLAENLRRSRGPWRIVAAHHPIAVERGDDAERASEYADYRERVLAEIRASGIRVQLFLAAHEHNLQVFTMSAPDPALHVVAGGGSSARKIRDDVTSRLEGIASLGFARVDRVGEGESERLVVSLHRVSGLPGSNRSRVAARWSVDLAGEIRAE